MLEHKEQIACMSYKTRDKSDCELQVSYNIQTGETTEVELRFIYADGTE